MTPEHDYAAYLAVLARALLGTYSIYAPAWFALKYRDKKSQSEAVLPRRSLKPATQEETREKAARPPGGLSQVGSGTRRYSRLYLRSRVPRCSSLRAGAG